MRSDEFLLNCERARVAIEMTHFIARSGKTSVLCLRRAVVKGLKKDEKGGSVVNVRERVKDDPEFAGTGKFRGRGWAQLVKSEVKTAFVRGGGENSAEEDRPAEGQE